ncbi:hypothetical protein FNJ87_12670 [Nonlabens mediterrranea]|uniref:Conjugal transfer protein TraG n=1 Tax=Nonlabens mediterrranea TaxID=1419947 RepID=A0ABS0A6Z8_9FLAO|nr:hypothetical protein [Nonlabens mediterrranea]
MEKEKVNKVLKHARNLRILIILYSLVYLVFAVWDIYLKDFFSTNFELKIYHILVLGLPIKAYAIWYVLNMAPNREQNKTNNVLGLLFFGVIGMWMTYPREKRLINRLKANNSMFSLKS